MDLKAYIVSKRMRMIDAAKELNICPATLSRIAHGHYKATDEMVNKIIKWSQGNVTKEDIKSLYAHDECPLCHQTIKQKNSPVLEMIDKWKNAKIDVPFGNNSIALMGVNE